MKTILTKLKNHIINILKMNNPEELQPTKKWEVPDTEPLTPRDMLSIISATVDQEGLIGHTMDGYNELVESGINGIMTHLFNINRMVRNERTTTEIDKRIKSYNIKFKFHGVNIGFPTCTTYFTGKFTDLYPASARLNCLPYSGPITLGATVILTAYFDDNKSEEKVAEIQPFHVGGLPIMVGSNRCHINNTSREARKMLGEDPTDLGGYFIIGGNEYVVDFTENIRYNAPHIHLKVVPNEHVRVEFLSQPGGPFDNSSLIRVRFMVNGQLTIEINSTKYSKVKLPFFLIYRLFGMTSDRSIAETIVYDIEDTGPNTTHMLDILEHAFQLSDSLFAPLIQELNREKVVQGTAEKIARYMINTSSYATNESAIQYLNEDLLGSPTNSGGLDKIFFPHMGQSGEDRIRKLRFLGQLIRKVLLVHLGVSSATDRDSLRNKRMHGPGVSLAKAFKTQVNNNLISPILTSYRRELKNNPWSTITEATIIDIFRSALASSTLNKAMEQAITSGNKTMVVIKQHVAHNRTATQILEHKNILNVLSSMRTIVTTSSNEASKQTDRANQMRRVHSTYTGFICIIQSADTGASVGMRKQLAITAGVCTTGDALPLKLRLLSDPEVTHIDSLASADIFRKRLSNIYINGEWIGACERAYMLVERYRKLRREKRIVDPHTTIYLDPVSNEIEFWLDIGRLRRPLLIVDNNITEYDAACLAGKPISFKQGCSFTSAHVQGILNGTVTLNDLIDSGVAEYITAEEQENCYVAPSIADLRAATNDITKQYTHCDVEQALFGLTAHISPYGNHTQPARVTYETNQARQTCGWYALNFPHRLDKNKMFQFTNEIPLVRTITHKYTPANGLNVIIAYMLYGGDNQEDSIIVNQASVDRGLFAGAFFKFELAELEKNESFCTPDPLTTKNLKPNASYEKLVDGFIKIGSTVRKNDVLIGRVTKLLTKSSTEKYQFSDRSIIYRIDEPAIVEGVLKLRGANDEPFGVVKLRYERPLRIGDKMCLTADHLVWCRMPDSTFKWLKIDTTPDVELLTGVGWAKPLEWHQYPLAPVFDIYGKIGTQMVIKISTATANHKIPILTDDGGVYMCEVKDLEFNMQIMTFKTGGNALPLFFHHTVACGAANVYCPSVPSGRFLTCLPGSIAHWTGNSSRSGNKSIISQLLSQSDMPYMSSGMTPDIIVNPHSFPSRMMIGQLMETLQSIVCAKKGMIVDGTAFLPVDLAGVSTSLVELGFRYNGRERMYNGITGEYFDTAIFVGPTAEQRLQKFVLDDEQVVAGSGPTDATTGQPLGGKHVQGGLKLGEMENWGLESHGCVLNMYEKTHTDSDGRVINVCRTCGSIAVFNEYHKIFDCRLCGDSADIAQVESTKSAVLFHEELAAGNIKVQLGLRPREFDSYT